MRDSKQIIHEIVGMTQEYPEVYDLCVELEEKHKTEVDELQKRIQAATAKWISVVSILTTTDSNIPDVIYKQLDELHDALCGHELEQALKGEAE